ncbi:MAG: rhomboid family intramembrane serine protease [Phycisphaerae bacterium]|nr:rhomboid family intramembrane serine protease [Phycisphaerae bacterium]
MFPLFDTTPRRQIPLVTIALIGTNTLVFAMQLSLPRPALEHFLRVFGVVPAWFVDPAWARELGYSASCCLPLVTSVFLHGGWLHLISNMWALWIFGDNVEDRMGPVRFLLFYLACGVISGVVHIATNLDSTVPTIGASGAIAGVLGAYLVLFPLARVVVVVPLLFWPFFFELPAMVYLGVWFLMQFFSGTLALAAPQAAGGIAWWAHIGGFAAGILSHRAFLIHRPAARRPYEDEYGVRGAWFDL